MKTYRYLVIDIVISILIALSTVHIITTKMLREQQMEQKTAELKARQHTVKAIALLEKDASLLKRSQISYPKLHDAYAVIHNDARAFKKTLYFGDSTDILDISVGQYAQSAIPGVGKPILVAGHNGTHFKQLRYFEKGDHVQIDTEYGSFVYEVYDTETMAYYDFDAAILDREEELLIMYCCYPFDSLSTDIRYFVYAKKTEGPKIAGDGEWKE